MRALCLCLIMIGNLVFSMYITRNHMIVLMQFGINKHLLIFAQTTNLLVLVYSKLHSNSRDYLQIEPLLSEVHVLFCLVFF